jgi:hypothetical protein
MPADFKLIEARQPPLKDQYDEWLARIICYAFSVPVSPFVSQVNRATSETLRQQAAQEGLVPLKAWVKNALDHVNQNCHERAEPRVRMGRRAGRGRRLPSQILVRPQMRHPVQTQSEAFPRARTEREHFLDRLRRLPSRADIHDLELRLGERMDSLAARFDRAFDPHHS